MALPIMLYDEQRLTPAWGYVFNRAWVNLDESIVSILWKFARLNAIAGPVVVSLAARKTIDSYEGGVVHARAYLYRAASEHLPLVDTAARHRTCQ